LNFDREPGLHLAPLGVSLTSGSGATSVGVAGFAQGLLISSSAKDARRGDADPPREILRKHKLAEVSKATKSSH
jgi:hypothetical protein